MKKNRRAFINQLTTMSTLPLLVKNPEDMLTHSGLRPKIGFNLLAWSAVISDKFYPVVDKLKTLGYDGVECAMDERNKAVYKTFGNHMADLGLQATAVLAVGADENPVEPVPGNPAVVVSVEASNAAMGTTAVGGAPANDSVAGSDAEGTVRTGVGFPIDAGGRR